MNKLDNKLIGRSASTPPTDSRYRYLVSKYLFYAAINVNNTTLVVDFLFNCIVLIRVKLL